jgi:hypothetical protein
MVFKYRGALHRYIQTEMEFMYISSLGATYEYVVKIDHKIKQRHNNLGLGTPHRKSQEKATQTHRTKDRAKMDSIRTTIPSHKQRTPERQRKIPRSGVTFIRALGITLLTSAQSSRWWPK